MTECERVRLSRLWVVALCGQCGDFRFTFGLTGRIITFIDKETDKGVRFPEKAPGIRPFLHFPPRDCIHDKEEEEQNPLSVSSLMCYYEREFFIESYL